MLELLARAGVKGQPADVDRMDAVLDQSAEYTLDDLLRIDIDGVAHYPGLQFVESGEIVPAVPALVKFARDAGWSSTDLLGWLLSPTTRLDGAVPADLLETDDGQVRVVTAGQLEMHTDW